MRILFFLTLCFLVASCQSKQKEPFLSLLKNCDEVDIVLYNGGDSLNFNTKDPKGIQIFTAAIEGTNNAPATTCEPSGEFRYKSKEQLLLTAPFATPKSSGRQHCDYVTYHYNNNTYVHKLSDRAERLLEQTYTLTHQKNP